ncbi:hypothetical protein GCM10008956_38440 [Deinococcus arenae]|uniref:Uncharacterized protein n=1 Tax=Deinococcus arenae TaxID=1452751 RepID=A0A8H9GSS8_9DEIO|nr:hypothetical protein [Deinococcus arenae]GGM59196.1 hypothetical protein GCM10008956_38440 [Deinococcus arenae]
MCHGFTPLHDLSTHRRVLRCTCGNLHVIWHDLNFALNHQEFSDLQGLLRRDDPQATQADWALHTGTHGTRLWCGATGVTFTTSDFGAFRHLILHAHPRPLN